MPRIPASVLALSLSAAFLSACGSPHERVVQVVETRRLDPPAELLACMAEPPAPDPATVTDRELASWIARLRVAGQDCRGKLAAVKRLTEQP